MMPVQFVLRCGFDNNEWETINTKLAAAYYKNTEICDEQQIEAGYQYITKSFCPH